MKALLTLLALLCLTGCSQRECDVTIIDPNGLITSKYHYKSNHLATKASVDVVEIVLPSGTVIRLNGVKQDNDSIRLRYNPVTKTVELITE